MSAGSVGYHVWQRDGFHEALREVLSWVQVAFWIRVALTERLPDPEMQLVELREYAARCPSVSSGAQSADGGCIRPSSGGVVAPHQAVIPVSSTLPLGVIVLEIGRVLQLRLLQCGSR